FQTTTEATTLLPGPTFISASLLGPTSVTLHWDDNATGESGYKLKIVRPTSTQILDLPTDTTSYSVTGLSSATQYQFSVWAYTDDADSPQSQTVTVTTLEPGQPIAPTN